MSVAQLPPYMTPRAIPYFRLEVGKAFATLTPTQRLYAHYFNRAGWCGIGACARQCSPESLPLLQFTFALFSAVTPAQLRERATAAGIAADEVEKVIEFAALLVSSSGNYLSFGDSKFIPACTRDVFEKVVAAANVPEATIAPEVLDAAFDHSAGVLSLALPPKGISAFYSTDITQADIDAANAVLVKLDLDACNTRVFKDAATGDVVIRVASANAGPAAADDPAGVHPALLDPSTVHNAEEIAAAAASGAAAVPPRVRIERGDHAPYMRAAAEALAAAKAHAANDTQRQMLDQYVGHFRSGDVRMHIESQRLWVKDQKPAVETNIGFIETYRDPSGVRAEWEGLVAVVDKEESERFDRLVNRAPEFLAKLPWPRDFERSEFQRPDFTSLQVLGFSSSGIPAGINLPNFDAVRSTVGFKNVYLQNSINAISFTTPLTHLTPEDFEIYKRAFETTMSVGVAIHELLGHGCGKLLSEAADGTRNFDPATINPLTGAPVATWYKPGETWSSKFGSLSNAIEECRAEAVALYLCSDPDLLAIFGATTPEAQADVMHIEFLSMMRSAIVGLEMWTDNGRLWRQAHCRARFCLLRTLLSAPNPVVTIDFPADGAETDPLIVRVDRERLATDGRAAVAEALRIIHINKSVADVAALSSWFEAKTEVDAYFERVRAAVLAQRKPRKQLVQAHTRVTADGSDVELLQFEPSADGAIQSFVTRHRDIPLVY